MSYTPTNWKSGDVVTSAKLNKLEQGVAEAGGGSLVVNLTETTTDSGPVYTCDKTAGEMFAAAPAIVFLGLEDGYYHVGQLGGYGYANGTYTFSVGAGAGGFTFTAASADAYPASNSTPR